MRSTLVMRWAPRVLVVAVLLVLAGTVLASALPVLDRDVMGSGGGRAEAAPYALNGTVGQVVAGTSVQAPYGLCAGFWCVDAAVGAQRYGLYLPVVIR